MTTRWRRQRDLRNVTLSVQKGACQSSFMVVRTANPVIDQTAGACAVISSRAPPPFGVAARSTEVPLIPAVGVEVSEQERRILFGVIKAEGVL